MLNNLTNFFNLIRGRRIKTQLEPSDLIAVGTKQSPALGDYKPTAITFADLQAQLGGGPSGPVCDITMVPQTITFGPQVNFNHPDFSSITVRDVINPGFVEITRDNNQGIFNPIQEGGYNFGLSPQDTGWNANGWTNLTDVSTRVYVDWRTCILNAFGTIPAQVGQELVMVDYTTGKYYAIKFTQWTSGGGGGFAYERREVIVSEKCEITYSDGTKQNSASGLVIGSKVTEIVNPDGTITYQIGDSSVLYSNVVFVDPVSGSDLTGTPGRFDKPYQTIGSAAVAASALFPGSTSRAMVYIRRGNYITNVQLLNNVDYYCEPGVTFTGGGQIRDFGVAVNSNFLGYAKFVNISVSTVLFWVQGASTVHFQFDTINQSFGHSLRVEPNSGSAEVYIEGNAISCLTLGVNYAIAPRNNSFVTLDIKRTIRAPHSIFDIRNFTGRWMVNCPRLVLSPENFVGGNFKQAIVQYSSSSNARFIFNGDIINEGTSYLGGISGMVTNWSACSGALEINGNIYAGQTLGVYASGNQTPGKIIVNGDIFSDIQPVYVSANNSCFVQNGVISKPSTFGAATIRIAAPVSEFPKLFIDNCQLYNALTDSTVIINENINTNLNLYNCIGQSDGALGFGIDSTVPINIRTHSCRFNKNLGVNVTDISTPSGYIADPNIITMKK